LRTKALVTVITAPPVGVNTVFAVNLSFVARRSKDLPAAVSVILIVAFPGAENVRCAAKAALRRALKAIVRTEIGVLSMVFLLDDACVESVAARPWAIELEDGRRCVFASGATDVAEGKRLNYICGTRNEELWGFPDCGNEPWTILAAPPQARELRKRSAVRHAWM
jgi:hypothetical protein